MENFNLIINEENLINELITINPYNNFCDCDDKNEINNLLDEINCKSTAENSEISELLKILKNSNHKLYSVTPTNKSNKKNNILFAIKQRKSSAALTNKLSMKGKVIFNETIMTNKEL